MIPSDFVLIDTRISDSVTRAMVPLRTSPFLGTSAPLAFCSNSFIGVSGLRGSEATPSLDCGLLVCMKGFLRFLNEGHYKGNSVILATMSRFRPYSGHGRYNLRPRNSMANVYPFPAIAGQERMKRALLLNAVNPRIGGVLIRGE